MGTVLQTTVVCLLLFGLVAGGEKAGKKLEKSESFDLKPSGQVAHQTVQLDNGVTCVFTYAAVGGTNEEWLMHIKKSKKHTYICSVERPEQASYLFFMKFGMSILEHNVLSAEVFDNSGVLLQDEDYMITEDLKSVQHKEGGFQSNLAKVVVTAKKTKTDKPNEL